MATFLSPCPKLKAAMFTQKENGALMSRNVRPKWKELTNMRKLQAEHKAMYAGPNVITDASLTDAGWHFPPNLHLEGANRETAHKNKHSSPGFAYRCGQRVCWARLTIYHVENIRNICDTPGESSNRITRPNRACLEKSECCEKRYSL
ncbi:hypothetical protein BaRGS_00031002 [Batillaria attramentaria]|uniref:Uncharacterized protein n=1 Tax=Batillaria attramentaria TaxID=370345 RepID=A0ABD0JT70_9CAEN